MSTLRPTAPESVRLPLPETLRSGKLVALFPTLLPFARLLLRAAGCPPGSLAFRSGFDADDFVQEACLTALEGRRDWRAGVTLKAFFRSILRSLLFHAKRDAACHPAAWLSTEEPAELCAPCSRREERIDARERFQAMELQLRDSDPEIRALFEVIEDSATVPAEMGEALGWTPARATTVRQRMQRALDAAGLWPED